MELALSDIGHMASRDEPQKSLSFRLDQSGGAGTPKTGLFHSELERCGLSEVARTSHHCDRIEPPGG